MLVKENVYMLEATRKQLSYGDMNVSSMVYAVVDNGITLIDCGFPSFCSEILKELKQIAPDEKVGRILLTHADADHIGNAYEIQEATGCKVYISEIEYSKYILSKKPRFGRKQIMYEDMGVKTPKLSIYPKEGVKGFTVIPTPGHSEGHVSILYRDILFPGDLCSFINGVFNGPNPLWSEDMEQALHSLASLKSYPFSYICPAHGMPSERTNDLN